MTSGRTLRHLLPVTFSPNRSVASAVQHILVADSEGTGRLAWVRNLSLDTTQPCAGLTEGQSSGGNQTIAYNISGALSMALLHTAAMSGLYSMCFKPDDGLWTHVTDRDLQLIPEPSFYPVTAVAGMVTPLTFSGQTPVGDWVAISDSDCSSAHNFSTGPAMLQSTQLAQAVYTDTNSGHLNTDTGMTTATSLVL